jgi:ubiquinone/menaquinone biosynthesis C-methylase UbiE
MMKRDDHDDADRYAGAGRRWATGATLVYGPIAAELVGMSPRSLAGRTVLDVGAGTGAVSAALAAIGARVVAVDRALDMLAWDAPARPPCAVADIRALPLPDGGVDAAVAAFVLNHLVEPADGLAELTRVTTPGGPILATVFSNASRSEARDQLDVVAQDAGWLVPDWYADLKTSAMPVLGTAAAMRAAAEAAGLAHVAVHERPVDVGVTTAEQLVRYRLGQPLYASWLDRIGPAAAERFAAAAAAAIRPRMQPYRPIVVFLAAAAP